MDKQGNPIPPERWGQLHDDEGYMRVGSDHICGVWVSTVWVGIDMNYTRQGPPIPFETMVFSKFDYLDLECWRYATEEEAREGHQTVVNALRDGRLILLAARKVENGRERHKAIRSVRSYRRAYRKGLASA